VTAETKRAARSRPGDSGEDQGVPFRCKEGEVAAGSQVGIVVVAAGSSSRFGSDKLAVRLGGRRVLERAVEAMQAALGAAPCILVVRSDRCEEARSLWSARGVRVVAGGARRQDSVRNGVEALRLADDAVAVVHDGARPIVPAKDVVAVVEAAAESGAALLVAPIADTVKRLGADSRVVETVPREQLARALTPQAFKVAVLRQAWRTTALEEWTDEAALVESVGGVVVAVAGDARNLKVTRPEDLELLAGRLAPQMRVGHGIDVHPFDAGRTLFLCGIELPGEIGLVGHSDADVALHAVTDALLGACGAGDIGQHFPPSDPQWRGARSEVFVTRALELAREQGLVVSNCDLTLLAEQPRISPHREHMRDRLAEILGVDTGRVNVKATTCEGLGFVGRREGLVAMATVTLVPASSA
jgi:2-C-methyl-D-erythritol 4-phosphate cytidylyltransferase/2-C-methyl-D-erythritol 2,4-cyclodiphosphate synthase